MDIHCNTPLPTAAPDFAPGADHAPKQIVRCVRGAAAIPPRAKFGEIAARGSGGKILSLAKP